MRRRYTQPRGDIRSDWGGRGGRKINEFRIAMRRYQSTSGIDRGFRKRVAISGCGGGGSGGRFGCSDLRESGAMSVLRRPPHRVSFRTFATDFASYKSVRERRFPVTLFAGRASICVARESRRTPKTKQGDRAGRGKWDLKNAISHRREF